MIFDHFGVETFSSDEVLVLFIQINGVSSVGNSSGQMVSVVIRLLFYQRSNNIWEYSGSVKAIIYNCSRIASAKDCHNSIWVAIYELY